MSSTEDVKSQYTAFIVDDTTYETIVPERYANRKAWERPNPKMITSFLPGTVLEINVKVGDVIKAGSDMFLFEAMKMHTIVKAPFDATVKAIVVTVGDKVPKGQLLIELE